jgi:hypothetical protein
MIPPQTSWYRQALAAPHNAYSRIEVWRSGVQVDELAYVDRGSPYTRGAPVYFGGAVRATLASRVTRQLDLTLPESLYPWEPDDLLNPYGTELRAFKGLRYGSGSVDEFPVFVGTIEEASPPDLGKTTIKASDTALRVAAAGFLSPLPSQVGAPITDEFTRLVLDANPLAAFGPFSAITALTPQLSYDSDRGQALDSLAGAASVNWYTLADGRYVLRTVPWTAAPASAPLAVADGDGGTLLTAYPVRSTSGIYNQITVFSDRSDGGPAVYATVSDVDPTSPTYVGGPFGVRTQQLRVTGAANQGQLAALARVQLQRSQALTASWQLTCVPDPAMELGDPLKIYFRGRTAVQFAIGFSLPLRPDANMQVQCRDLVGVDA